MPPFCTDNTVVTPTLRCCHNVELRRANDITNAAEGGGLTRIHMKLQQQSADTREIE